MLWHAAQGAGGLVGAAGGWDLSTAVFNASPINFLNITQDDAAGSRAQLQGLFFKPDGTAAYITGISLDNIYQYSLSTAWDIGTGSFVQSLSVSAQDTTPRDIFFKPDGTKMYLLGSTGDDVNEYDLSTAWDISTASYLQNFSVVGQDTTPTGIFFKSDGSKMYVTGIAGDDINEYDLSTAWDISTASYLQNFSVVGQDTSPIGIFFKPDGSKMYVTGSSGDDINEYGLSTAWDISTASYVQNFSVAGETAEPRCLFFKSDGTKLYITSTSVRNAIIEYDLSTAWDISTASFTPPTSDYFYAGVNATDPRGLYMKSDGTKMYIVCDGTNAVHEYNLSTAWNIATSSHVQSFSVGAQEASPGGIFFKTDGTKMYVIGFSGDDINEYDLSTAWDISTASYLQVFYIGSRDSGPRDLYFSDDGINLYIIGSGGREINQFSLSTAWDISTTTYVRNRPLSGTGQSGIFFKPDGTKMYWCGYDIEAVYEYDLSTAWDISTATFIQSLSTSNLEPLIHAVAFKPDDGTKMFILGDMSCNVWAYNL